MRYFSTPVAVTFLMDMDFDTIMLTVGVVVVVGMTIVVAMVVVVSIVFAVVISSALLPVVSAQA